MNNFLSDLLEAYRATDKPALSAGATPEEKALYVIEHAKQATKSEVRKAKQFLFGK